MTNDEVIQAFGDFLATKKVKHIQVNLYTFTILANNRRMFLDIVTEAELLKTGYVGYYLGAKLWINPTLSDNWICFSNEDIKHTADNKWSLPVNLEWDIDDIPRMWKIKAFW